MTQSEQRVIIEMLKEHAVAFAALVEVLKSREVVQAGDLEAYTEALARSGKKTLIETHVEEAYRGFAEISGVEPPPPLEDEF